jgi:hypothetical protein
MKCARKNQNAHIDTFDSCSPEHLNGIHFTVQRPRFVISSDLAHLLAKSAIFPNKAGFNAVDKSCTGSKEKRKGRQETLPRLNVYQGYSGYFPHRDIHEMKSWLKIFTVGPLQNAQDSGSNKQKIA